MSSVLAWQNLIYYLPLGFGTVLALGTVFGFLEDGAAASSELDPSGETEGEASVLETGGIPWLLRLMLLSFGFGGAGLVLGPWVRELFTTTLWAGHIVTLISAGLTAGLVTRASARLIARYTPLLESETVRRHELVGTSGHLVVTTTPAGGALHVRDRRGNLLQLPCRLLKGEEPLAAGTEVIVMEYDEEQHTFTAIKSPLTE